MELSALKTVNAFWEHAYVTQDLKRKGTFAYVSSWWEKFQYAKVLPMQIFSAISPCLGITCGDNQACVNGKCECLPGFVLVPEGVECVPDQGAELLLYLYSICVYVLLSGFKTSMSYCHSLRDTQIRGLERSMTFIITNRPLHGG